MIRSGAAADRRTPLKPGAQLDLASPYAAPCTRRTESPMSLNYAKLYVELNYTGAAIGEMWGDLVIRHCIDVQRTPIYVCRVSHVTVCLDGAHRKTVLRSLLTYVKLRLQAILTNVIYTMSTFFWLICLAVSLLWPCGVSPRPDVRHRVDCFIQMINLWTSNYLQSQYSIFVNPKLM